MRVAAEARYTIVAVDTNVDTLILDGQAFRARPWNAVGHPTSIGDGRHCCANE